MNKQKTAFLLLVPILLIFSAGCSDQRNHFNTEISNSQNNGETVVGSPDPAEDVIEFTEEENTASLNYLSQAYSINISEEKPKVVLDTDMTFLGDDAFCLSILVQADNIGLIDLVGVTVTGGNSFVSVGTNAALRQLELWGRSDIPVYMGTDEPLNGFRNLENQRQVVGSIGNWGAMANLDSYVEEAVKNSVSMGKNLF
ncbi:MAG: nucleoside hydrolase [Acetatifactor sp.]